MNTHIDRFPPLPSMLVSRICLGINVYQINIEREGKENLVRVSTIMTRNDVAHRQNESTYIT